MRYPSRAVAELARWAKQHGCVYEGVAQSGHVKFRLPNGQKYTASASPSDVNSVKAAKQGIAKILGIRLEKPRSGKYKRGVRATGRKEATERVDSVSAQYARLAKRHRELCTQINHDRERGDKDDCRVAIADLLEVEQQITALGRRPPLEDVPRMRTHPPLFNRLTNRLHTNHPVNILARRIARREDDGRLHAEIRTILAPWSPYRGAHHDDPLERDDR